MAKPQILVLAGPDAMDTVSAAGFPLAGDLERPRQTAAAVIDARGGAAHRAQGLVRSLKSALGPRAGLFFAWVEPGQRFEPGLFDGVFPSDTPPAFLAARLESALRLAVMADEAALRFQTLAAFGGSVRPPVSVADSVPRILLYGSPSPTALAMTATLEDLGASVVSAFSSFTAFDYLHEGGFDAVALVAGDDAPAAGSFCAALRRNSRLFHLPCLVLCGPDFGSVEPLLARGASDAVVAGIDDAAAGMRLLGLVGEKRQRDALSLAFAAARTARALDPGTGLYTSAFLEAHLARLARRAEQTDRPLSVASLSVTALPRAAGPVDSRQFDRVVGQAGSMLGRLVRAEDAAGAIDRTRFAVLFPASSEAAAETAARRIAAVLECTAFDSGQGPDQEPVQLAVSVASASLAPQESGPALLKRALARLPVLRGAGE